MTANAKTNGQNKKEIATPTKEVQQKLAQEAVTTAPVATPIATVTTPSLDDCIDKFEKIRGLPPKESGWQRRLPGYPGSITTAGIAAPLCLRTIQAWNSKTTNTNLIKLFATELQNTQETRKGSDCTAIDHTDAAKAKSGIFHL